MTAPILVAAGVARAFGRGRARVRAVDDVTLELIAGEVAGLTGHQGAGKTTLLRMLAGVLACDAGTVTIAGYAAGTHAARRCVGFGPDGVVFPPALRVREVLEYYASLHESRSGRRVLVARALAVANLTAIAEQPAAGLGPGDRVRLVLAQATLGGRRVVLLDEPFTGLDGPGRMQLAGALHGLARRGSTILVTTRDPGALERLATRVVLLHRGRVVGDGAPAELLGPRVLELVVDRGPAEPPPGLRRTAVGLEADLGNTSAEAVLALCRAFRVAVRASRVREPSLHEVLGRAAGTQPEHVVPGVFDRGSDGVR